MRTLTAEDKALRDWAIANWDDSWREEGGRRYSVRGMLVFRMKSIEPVPSFVSHHLEEAVKRLDREFPWKDNLVDFPHRDAERIRCLGTAELTDMILDRYGVFIVIEPVCDRLTKGQVYGYEQYLKKIARELCRELQFDISEVCDHGFNEVYSVMQVTTITESKA